MSRARCQKAIDWPWSSVHAHLGRKGDGITQRKPVHSRHPGFSALIESGEDEAPPEKPREAETIGRPLGTEAFITKLKRKSGHILKAAKRGPKPESQES